MKITDIRTALIGHNIVLRVVTDKDGIDGYSEFENTKESYIDALLVFYKDLVLGADPTNINDIISRLRRTGGFKPWGAVVSAIEMACWDIAGKEAGLPVYKLLGGKVRDRVRVYNTGCFKTPYMWAHAKDENDDLRYWAFEDMSSPEGMAESMLKLKEMPEGISMCKTAFAWHRGDFWERMGIKDFAYNTYISSKDKGRRPYGSLLTERGYDAMVNYVDRMKSILKDEVGLALDCGPGMTPVDAMRFAKDMEPYHLMWLEDMIAGDYTPSTLAHVYRDITVNTQTPIHTGEQIYLRDNYRELIEGQCVNVIGPDPADCGGLLELKWITEYADLHGIMMSPHGTFDGIFGMAALMQVGCTLPNNLIAFEFPGGSPLWWYDIVEGLPNDYLRGGCVKVWDKPGIGVEFNIPKAEKHLLPKDKDFFR